MVGSQATWMLWGKYFMTKNWYLVHLLYGRSSLVSSPSLSKMASG